MKRIIAVITILIITVAANLIAQPQLDKAKDLLKQNKAAEAIAVCQSIIKTSPRDENAWLILAKACQQLNMLDSAENAAKKVVEIDDEMLEGYAVLGQVQIAKKKFQEAGLTANSGLSKIKKKLPKYPALLVVQAQSLLAAGNADEALVAAASAKEIDPNYTVAYETMGDAYSMQKVYPMAANNYEKSLEIDSLQVQVLYKLASTYVTDKKYTDAAKVYLRLLNLQPDNVSARLELAGLLYRAKQYSKCAAILKEYFEKEKKPSKEIQLIYLESLLKARLYKEAAQMGQEYLKKEPNSTLAYRAIANGYFNEKKYVQAVESFKKIDSLEFEDYRWLGQSYKLLKKDTLAALTWEEGLKDSSQSINVRSYYLDQIAAIWMSLKSYDKAGEAYQRRIQIDTNAVGAYINYAQCMMQLERFERATIALKKAIALNLNYPPAHVNLGFCYFQMKEYDVSRKEFEAAIQVADTADWKYRVDIADSYRMIALTIMVEKKSTDQESIKKWETAISYLKKSLKFKEDIAQTHLNLGKCYQNLSTLDILNTSYREEAIKEYKRTLKLDSKNEDARTALKNLE
jgi:tetratricopeptide (TPR) repeat protein